MSTVSKINFEPVSDINVLHRRDFQLYDPTLINPMNAVCIVDGEWVGLNTSNQLVRATDITVNHNPATAICFPIFYERGRYDGQALAEKRMTILLLGQYEFDTRVYHATDAVGSGAAITAVLQPLKVATVSITMTGVGTRYFTGLVGSQYTDNAPIVGYVTRLPANNHGKLRFISGWAVQNGTT